jgi:hippurate hydrolase
MVVTDHRETLMPILDRVREYHDNLTEWRRDIHAHPELGFEEQRTSDFVADKLKGFGIEVHRNIGKTGLVGRLSHGNSPRTIGLRADMDCLPILEANQFRHRSQNPGRMHACGHDGHTTMLLGAAKYLAETKNFDGTVHFIFQPAEEGLGGAEAMVKDGLFDRFPCDSIYGMHNRPGLAVGKFQIRAGAMMAGGAFFDIAITGKGAHGARPRRGSTPWSSPRRSRPRSRRSSPATSARSIPASSASRRSTAATPITSSRKRPCCAAPCAASRPRR